jgi:hypothetical protein
MSTQSIYFLKSFLVDVWVHLHRLEIFGQNSFHLRRPTVGWSVAISKSRGCYGGLGRCCSCQRDSYSTLHNQPIHFTIAVWSVFGPFANRTRNVGSTKINKVGSDRHVPRIHRLTSRWPFAAGWPRGTQAQPLPTTSSMSGSGWLQGETDIRP